MSDEDTTQPPKEADPDEQRPPEPSPEPEQSPEQSPPPERDDTAVEPPDPGHTLEADPGEPPKMSEVLKKKDPPKKPPAKKKAPAAKKTPAKKASEKLAEAGEGKRKQAPKPKSEPKPKSADLVLAHRATALATGGSVKDGVLKVGEQKFGAPVNANQFALVREKVKGKNILQLLGCKEKELKGYADGSIKAKDLPEQTRKVLAEMNKGFDSKLKMWPRKDAAILYVLQQERKKGATPKRSDNKAPAASAA